MKNRKRDAAIVLIREGWSSDDIAEALGRSDRWVRAIRSDVTVVAMRIRQDQTSLTRYLEEYRDAMAS